MTFTLGTSTKFRIVFNFLNPYQVKTNKQQRRVYNLIINSNNNKKGRISVWAICGLMCMTLNEYLDQVFARIFLKIDLC